MSGLRRGRSLNAVERALWQAAMQGTEPLPGRPKLPPPAPVLAKPDPLPSPPPPAIAAAASPPKPLTPLPVLTYAATPGLDRRTSARLKRGELPIDARLDLHGRTQDAARHALDHFLGTAFERGCRAVLIITGKGGRHQPDPGDLWAEAGAGVLRRAVPRWLNEAPNRGRVLAFTEAKPQHGGGGALYVLIRRRRT